MAEHRVAVAYSGGRDSSALLHATLRVARELGVQVHALHVHHGLSEHADAWLDHCEGQCRRWARQGWPVTFSGHRLDESPTPGDSVEAWARRARYRALGQMARFEGVDLVLLAHHQRDQAETLLLQALRGAGVAGLSGMPRSVAREGITWLRPWLDRPRAQIEAYVRRHRLRFIDDDSNGDPRFARNRLRLQVWPALVGAFAQAESQLASAAGWAQEARAAMDDLAQADLAVVASEHGLSVGAWQALPQSRQGHALRTWIQRTLGAHPPASLIVRLREELPRQRSARWPLGEFELRLHRGTLRCEPLAARDVGGAARESRLSVRGAGTFELPGWRGALRVSPVCDSGVPLAWLARLDLRERAGGEQFQSGTGRPPRSLKKQYQDRGVAAWYRDGPLIYSGGQLVFVPGLGLDARILGLPGQPLVDLQWLSADGPASGADGARTLE